MDLGPLRSLALTLNLSAHGVAAVVTRPVPDNTPINTRVIWLPPVEEGQPFGSDLRRYDPRGVMALSKADVPTLPAGTTIVAALPAGGDALTWRYDGQQSASRPDYWTAIVKQVSA